MKKINFDILLLTSVMCLVPILFGLYCYQDLPKIVAVHFDINNNPDIDIEITISPNTYVATFFKSGDEIKDSMKETYTYEYTLDSDGYVRKINFGPVSWNGG